jgi:dihydroxy-acid dehydratase
MVRLSDARMSGTAYGTIVLHITPDAASGGPLSLVRDGDRIRLCVANRSLELLVADEELDKRRAAMPARDTQKATRGYAALYEREILQADEGCDFRFLK